MKKLLTDPRIIGAYIAVGGLLFSGVLRYASLPAKVERIETSHLSSIETKLETIDSRLQTIETKGEVNKEAIDAIRGEMNRFANLVQALVHQNKD